MTQQWTKQMQSPPFMANATDSSQQYSIWPISNASQIFIIYAFIQYCHAWCCTKWINVTPFSVVLAKKKKTQFQKMLILEVLLKITEVLLKINERTFPKIHSRICTKILGFFIQFHNSTILPEIGCFFESKTPKVFSVYPYTMWEECRLVQSLCETIGNAY